jgi:hypothetical protein
MTMPDGPVGMLTASLAYRRGNDARSFGLDTGGSTMSYPEYVDGLLTGGNASVVARTRVGGGLTVGGNARVSYDPVFSAFLPSAGGELGPGVPELVPSTGLYQQRSLSTSGTGTVEQRVGSSGMLSASYTYGRFTFTDNAEATGTSGDNSSQAVATTYNHTLTPSVSLRASYSYNAFGFDDADLAVGSSRSQRVEGGATLGRVPVTLSLMIGMARLTTTDAADAALYDDWLPSGSATLAVTRDRWDVQALYARDFSLLQGLTTDVYVLDRFSLSANLSLTRGTTLQVAGSFAHWQIPDASSMTTAFDVLGANIALSQRLGGRLSAFASYGYYNHEYSDPASLPPTFPPLLDRLSFRVGLAVNVPLIGGGRRGRTGA